MEPLNPSQRREYVLVETVDQMADIWPVAEDLERRAKLMFPEHWFAEIRITQGIPSNPRGYKVKAFCSYTLTTYPFQMLILSPATSRPDLGCWVIRAFKIQRPTS